MSYVVYYTLPIPYAFAATRSVTGQNRLIILGNHKSIVSSAVTAHALRNGEPSVIHGSRHRHDEFLNCDSR